MMEGGGVQRKSSEKQAQRKFTPEFKSQAVKRVSSGHKIPVVAKELGDRREPAAWLGDLAPPERGRWSLAGGTSGGNRSVEADVGPEGRGGRDLKKPFTRRAGTCLNRDTG